MMNLTAREAALMCAALNIAETVDDLNALHPLYQRIYDVGTALTEPDGDKSHFRVFYDTVTEYTNELQHEWQVANAETGAQRDTA